MAPAFQAASQPGGQNSTGTSLTITWPSGHQTNDIGIIIIETSGNSATITPPSGWADIPGTPVTDVATTAGSKLHVWWKRATSSSEPTVATGTATDHILTRLYTFRGCVETGNPWNVTATGVKTTASTTATVPSLTTTVDDTYILMLIGRPDDSSSTTHFGTPVNANLTGLADIDESGTVTGNGGGFAISYGIKSSPGSTGTSTLTKTASTTDTYVVLALKATTELIGTVKAFTLSGVTTGLLQSSVILATTQTYTYDGTTTGLLRASLLDTITTPYTVDTVTTNLFKLIPLNATTATYNVVGNDANFSKALLLNLNTTAYNVVGNNANFNRALLFDLNTTTYTINGIDSNLLYNKTFDLIPTSLSMRLQSNGDFFWYRTTQTIPIVKPRLINRNQWILGRATHMGQRRL
jgi:hypothetical protein